MKKQLLAEIKQISNYKKEPDEIFRRRIKALDYFLEKKMPSWGVDLSEINFKKILYFKKSQTKNNRDWQDVPQKIRDTYEKLGLPEAEQKFLAGVGAQYESEMVYHNLKIKWEKKGIIFLDTDSALRKHPGIFLKYFGTVVPANDNKFAALNSAFWSGGSFLYVPKGVKFTIPIQTYFRIESNNLAQFERTLIIAEEDSEINYIEGCTAPILSDYNLHAGVVEIIVKKNARVRYTTIQNWSTNVYNLVTKRAIVNEGGFIEWIDGNFGSKKTMKYPAAYLVGEKARADILSITTASHGQHQDAGAKVLHLAPQTSSIINSKSIASSSGHSTFRALIRIDKKAKNAKTKISCNGLILDDRSQIDSVPQINVLNNSSQVEHEAKISNIDEDKLFYLQTKGFSKNAASSMIVNGFADSFVKKLPMEYAVEINRLIEMNIEKSVI